MLRYLVLTVAALSMGAFRANAAEEPDGAIGELALSNDTLQLRYLSGKEDIGTEDSLIQGTVFLSEERDLVMSAALLFPVAFGIDRLSISFGPQVYAALLNDENQDIMAVSLGAKLRFLLFQKMNVAIAGEAFYAPDILTFGSADNLTDLSARIELDVAPRVTVFGGMRWFEFDLTEGGGTQTLQEEVFVGAGYRF
jgi:hypothetical protein